MRLIAIASLLCLAGCATTPEQVDRAFDIAENVASNLNAGAAELGGSDSAPPSPAPPSAEPLPLPSPQTEPAGFFSILDDDFAEIKKFRNSADCSKWPVTVQISNVRIEGKNIAWDEVKGQREAREWNVKTGKKSINGEAIFLIPSRGESGMFDYLGVGQTRKTLSNIYPSNEGQGFFSPWVPAKGERVGFCIATISRDKSAAKMQERSNVVWFTWP